MNRIRMCAFARRVLLDILRDKLTLFFELGFPLGVMTLLCVIQKNVPVQIPMFQIESLAPGIAVFGLSFVSLFSGMLTARDRSGALLMRLRSSPMTACDYMLGYLLPLLPLAAGQCLICLLFAHVWGLPFSPRTALCLVSLVPAMVLFSAIGLLCGLTFSDRQVGSVCGALLTNLTAWLGGIWFDTALLGRAFGQIARALPFSNAVEAGRAALTGNGALAAPLAVVSLYALAALTGAILLMRRRLRE